MSSIKESPQIDIDHTGFVVPDLADAVSFFTEHFGASIEFQVDRSVDETDQAATRLGADRRASFALTMLNLGSARVELLQWWPASGPATASPNVVGAAHLAIAVFEVSATIHRLREVAGVTILSSPLTFDEGPTPGLTNAFFTTPWGMLIEIVSWD